MFVWCAKQVVYFTACVSLFVSCLCREGGGAQKWVHDSVHCVVHPLLCIIVKWQPHLLVVVPQCWHYPRDRSVTPCTNTVHSHEEHAVFCVHGTFQCQLLTSEFMPLRACLGWLTSDLQHGSAFAKWNSIVLYSHWPLTWKYRHFKNCISNNDLLVCDGRALALSRDDHGKEKQLNASWLG